MNAIATAARSVVEWNYRFLGFGQNHTEMYAIEIVTFDNGDPEWTVLERTTVFANSHTHAKQLAAQACAAYIAGRGTRISDAPRNVRHLERFVYRAAGELDADAKNARTAAEEAHARRGRQLCAEMFGRIAGGRVSATR
jgi:hypothetical protein